MSEDRGPWKRRFLLLLNNAEADKDLPKMWVLFKRNNLATTELIKSATVKIKGRLQKSESEELDKLYEDASGNEARLLTRIKDCDQLSDDFWRLLFAEVRDTECHPISRDKTTLISEGGLEYICHQGNLFVRYDGTLFLSIKNTLSVGNWFRDSLGQLF